MGQWRAKQPTITAGPAGKPQPGGGDWGVLGECPAIREFLCDPPEDKPGGDAATLLFYVDQKDGLVHLCLHDRSDERSTWASGEGFQDALLALEDRLQSGRAEWRVKGGVSRSRKRG